MDQFVHDLHLVLGIMLTDNTYMLKEGLSLF
jgi:hypothetical protein